MHFLFVFIYFRSVTRFQIKIIYWLYTPFSNYILDKQMICDQSFLPQAFGYLTLNYKTVAASFVVLLPDHLMYLMKIPQSNSWGGTKQLHTIATSLFSQL